MVDQVSGGGGGLLQALLQNAQRNQETQAQNHASDASADSAIQDRVIKHLLTKQQAHHDHLVHDTRTQQLHKAAIDKRLGPGVAEWAGAEQLQKKLTDKQRQLFLAEASKPSTQARANAAGKALADLSKSAHFSQGAPTSRAVGNLQASLLERPEHHGPMKQAVDSRFMGDRGGDKAAKEGFLRFAAKHGDTRGISVRMGGDMLGSLSGAQVPGFAQRAAVRMMERNPDNARGVQSLDNFVREAEVRAMPALARGRATEVLARADGAEDVRDGLTEMAQEGQFRGLNRGDKARFFATLGQGRASEIRAITDQTLIALRASSAPLQSGQVSRFLGTLSRQITKGNKTASEVDPKALLRAAKRGSMPSPPLLMDVTDQDEEAAQRARSFNRAGVMRYYSELTEHYDGIEQQIKNAKYFEDVNLLTGLKEARPLDTQALKVSDPVRAAYAETLGSLRAQLETRELTRKEYVDQVRAVYTQALGRSDLTTDEKTWLGAETSHAALGQTFLDLTGKKNRKLRDVGKNLMPPAKRRQLAQERRTLGEQPRYFKPDAAQDGMGARVTALPVPSGASMPAVATANARGRSVGQGGSTDMRQLERQLASLNLDGQSKQMQQVVGLVREAVSTLTQAMQGMQFDAPQGPSRPAPTAVGTAKKESGPTISGKQDGWGIPRTFERDLGAAHNVTPVRAAIKQEAEVPQEGDEVMGQELAPARILKPTTSLRDVETLYGLAWKELTKAETAVLRNLSWDQKTWNAKGQPGASWPRSMATPYSQLDRRERAAVQALGFTEMDWDSQIVRQTKGR